MQNKSESETPPEPQSGCVFYCFFLVFMVVTLVRTEIAFSKLYFATKSLSWPSCEGTIQHAEARRMRQRYGELCVVSIRYDYTVADNRYTGSRYNYDTANLSWKAANKIVSEYPVGTVVKVYYSPSSPQESVLVPGRSWINWLNFGVHLGAIFFLIGALVFVRNHVKATAPNTANRVIPTA